MEEFGRRTAAIYLWGYAAEMTVKAAYFSVFGFDDADRITTADLYAAKNRSEQPPFNIKWDPKNLHNVGAWAEFLVEYRNQSAHSSYLEPTFGVEVIKRGRRISELWSETLRYHKNVAYSHEVSHVGEAAAWFVLNSREL